MKTVLYLVQKEFLQIFRNRFLLPILFIMPFVQLILLSYAANFEIKHLKIHVINQDFSPVSYQLINKIQGSTYFDLSSASLDVSSGYRVMEKDEADLVLRIPPNFEKHLRKDNQTALQLLINAINGTQAGLANAYLNAIINDFNQQLRMESIPSPAGSPLAVVNVEYRNWFNPLLDYKFNIVPGILVTLVTMIGVFLTGLNIVREKEIGTIEQLNVTTMKKHHFILGKLIPFWIIALIDIFIGLSVALFWFEVPFVGSFWLMMLFINLYMIAVLGLGMFISTISHTQQQAMFVSFFLIIIFMLMSGLFTPIENMPYWAQWITRINPIAYAVEFMRMVMLRGSGLPEVAHLIGAVTVFAIASNTLAVWNYRKTAQ